MLKKFIPNIFQHISSKKKVFVSFFEIYMDKCFDLFNSQTKCKVVEDEKGDILIKGLEEKLVEDGAGLISLLEEGFNIR